MVAHAMLSGIGVAVANVDRQYVYHFCGHATASRTVESVLDHLSLEWQHLFGLDPEEVASKRQEQNDNRFEWLLEQYAESYAERFQTGEF
jgi:hypothetical protein